MTELAAELSAGTMVGGYRIIRRLGSGGMGTVYAAEEPDIGKRVAIKVLRLALADDAGFVSRFKREARAANAVSHPAIVDAFAFGRLPDGRPYFVMSLLEGRSLRQELEERGPLPPAEAWRLARDVADALSAAHEAGIVHRDLKPDNVFLEADRAFGTRVRILDFGIAKSVAPDSLAGDEPLTGSSVMLGTPRYMAPEQWWQAPVDAATDQYALGVMLYELLTGAVPFAATSQDGLMKQVLHAAPPPLAERGAKVPAAVEELVSRLLAKEQSERFESLRQVIAAGDEAFAAPGSTPPAAAQPAADPADPLATADPQASASTRPAAATGLCRVLLAHLILLGGGSAGLLALGYAGAARRDVGGWFQIAGLQAYLGLLLFVAGAAGLPLLARRRARTGRPTALAWVLGLLPAVSGALGTYMGWQAVKSRVAEWAPTERFATFNAGAYEAGASRFMGFAFAAMLCLSLVAAAGLGAGRAAGARSLPAEGRLELTALLFALALAAAALVLAAGSGAFVAAAAAVALGLALAFPLPLDDRGAPAPAAYLERAAAMVLAVLLAAGVALVRLEGRAAVLWDEQPTRSARVLEILAVEGERQATWPLVIASLLAVALPAAWRLQRLGQAGRLPRLRLRAALPLLLLIGAVALDVRLTRQFLAVGEQIRAELAPQLKLFARLDPPAAELHQLDRRRFAPHKAPAMQLSRDMVAVDGRPLAKLAALESAAGVRLLTDELARAMAEAGARRGSAEPLPDLSCSIDRQIRWPLASRVLAVAYAAGARRIELLLTRGQAPELPASGPPEVSYLLAQDFVAVPAILGRGGLAGEPESTFAQLAPQLVELASRGEVVQLRIDPPPAAER